MTELRERDMMVCRACGREERASEGYPCADCGTFFCLICNFRGVMYCRTCAARHDAAAAADATPAPGAPADAPPADVPSSGSGSEGA